MSGNTVVTAVTLAIGENRSKIAYFLRPCSDSPPPQRTVASMSADDAFWRGRHLRRRFGHNASQETADPTAPCTHPLPCVGTAHIRKTTVARAGGVEARLCTGGGGEGVVPRLLKGDWPRFWGMPGGARPDRTAQRPPEMQRTTARSATCVPQCVSCTVHVAQCAQGVVCGVQSAMHNAHICCV